MDHKEIVRSSIKLRFPETVATEKKNISINFNLRPSNLVDLCPTGYSFIDLAENKEYFKAPLDFEEQENFDFDSIYYENTMMEAYNFRKADSECCIFKWDSSMPPGMFLNSRTTARRSISPIFRPSESLMVNASNYDFAITFPRTMQNSSLTRSQSIASSQICKYFSTGYRFNIEPGLMNHEPAQSYLSSNCISCESKSSMFVTISQCEYCQRSFCSKCLKQKRKICFI